MNKTKIEWADHTWNPLTGCLHGCSYCYAERITKRFGGDVRKNLADKRCKKQNGIYVLEEEFLNDTGGLINYPFGFAPTYHKYRLSYPAKLKNGANIFVCSMADLFGEWVPDKIIKDVFEICRKCPQHNYMFLTKNPGRYIDLARKHLLPFDDNMWFGSTVDVPERKFFFSECNNTFLSIEPLLAEPKGELDDGINWVIIGAESGNRKGKIVPKKEWIDHIVAECDKKNVPVFMKDSLVPVIGEENMRRDFPEGLKRRQISEKLHDKLYDTCMYCNKDLPMKSMIALLYRVKRGEGARRIGYACKDCFYKNFPIAGGEIDEKAQLQNDE